MANLISNQLFEEVLLKPIESGATSLSVVTGYASPAMVTRHLDMVRERYNIRLDLDVLVGMVGRDGISRASLLGFRSVMRQIPGSTFRCALTTKSSSIHSKLYVWSNDSGPVKAFMGSANYTQFGFGLSAEAGKHSELLLELDPHDAFNYSVNVASSTIDVNHPEIASYVDVLEESNQPDHGEEEHVSHLGLEGRSVNSSVLLPLVQVRKNPGQVHNAGAGLNWGQRGTRNRNEAYLPVPISVQISGFFPPKGEHFQVITSDGESFIATTAQEGGKALETPNDNAILGDYFRRRLGVKAGAFVQSEDLARFGSNSVEFVKIEPGLYLLDFRPGLVVNLW